MRKLEQYQPEKQKKGEQTGLISVIVTVYNIREYLPKAVDSILSSTYQNLEVLLIDDGSTDGSERICDEYAKKDGRVRVVHQRNGGAYSARNTGLLEAKGDYLTFVDGDDWIEPQMYETLLAAMMEQDADLAVCRYRKIYENRRVDLSTPMAAVFEGQGSPIKDRRAPSVPPRIGTMVGVTPASSIARTALSIKCAFSGRIFSFML